MNFYFGIPSDDSETRTVETDEPVSEERVSQTAEADEDDPITNSSETEDIPAANDPEEKTEIAEKKPDAKQKRVLDSFTEAKTTYYYYRSSDEKKIITSDKSRVDSLINEYDKSFQERDSINEPLPVKKKDS